MAHRIVVAEDSATQLEALRTLLEAAGFDVAAHAVAEEALAWTREHGADLVISDIVMPGMSGYELCRAIKTQVREPPPVVLLTTLADARDIVRGLEAGADNYITKPYDPDHLVRRIHQVIENRLARQSAAADGSVSIRFLGETFRIDADREQILGVLLSSFEELIRTNNALEESKQALADAHARELAREQVAREAAESTARRMELLAGASAALSSSFDEHEAIREVARLAVPALGDVCVIDAATGPAEDGRLVAVAHEQATTAVLLEQLFTTTDSDSPWRGMTRGAEATVLEPLPDRFFEILAPDPEAREPLRRVGLRAGLIVPLTARERRLGALALFTTGEHRSFSAEQRGLATELAGRISLAIENRRLFRRAERDRNAAERVARRIAGLQAVTAALSEALTTEDVVGVIVQQGTAVSGAEAGIVMLRADDDSVLELAGEEGWTRGALPQTWARVPLDEPLGLTDAVLQRAPVFVASPAELHERFPRLAVQLDHDRHHAWAAVPLLLKGEAIGVLAFGFAEAREFGEEDRSFLVSLARQAAQALDRARLFDSEKDARSEAEAATRLRDDVLAIVSHDLRNPLGIIFTGTSLLLDLDLGPEKEEEQLRIVRRAAQRMDRLISDLLDVSRFESGTVTLETEPIPADELLREAHDLFLPLAREKNLDFSLVPSAPLPAVQADRERVLQVFSNLIGNAIKFTPADGSVRLHAELHDGAVRFIVDDDGEGIAAEDLPRIFDRFWQARKSAAAGAGLGLAIVKAIVTAHGGTIHAESQGGRGSTFSFTLPQSAG
jgi:signal transduction histidine kinase/DNA-binding response OmpR family regulator